MEHQLRNHVRLALVKLREYNSLGEQHEQQLRRILSPGDSIDLTVAKLLQCEPRNDYQLLILMTFLSELVGGKHYVLFSIAATSQPEHPAPPTT